MYNDITLRFVNEASFKAAWPYWQDKQAFYPLPAALDVVGITYRSDTPQGEPPVARTGYLVNLRLPVDDVILPALEVYVIPNPVKLAQVWV
jgi:hypothetical protein